MGYHVNLAGSAGSQPASAARLRSACVDRRAPLLGGVRARGCEVVVTEGKGACLSRGGAGRRRRTHRAGRPAGSEGEAAIAAGLSAAMSHAWLMTANLAALAVAAWLQRTRAASWAAWSRLERCPRRHMVGRLSIGGRRVELPVTLRLGAFRGVDYRRVLESRALSFTVNTCRKEEGRQAGRQAARRKDVRLGSTAESCFAQMHAVAAR